MIEDCTSINVSDQELRIAVNEEKEILSYKSGMMTGGFFPGLFSVDTSIVSIKYDEIRRGHVASINGENSGETKVYFVNGASAGVVKLDSTERAYWLGRLEGSKFYFTVEVD